MTASDLLRDDTLIPVKFKDGTVRSWDPRLKCFVRSTEPAPVPEAVAPASAPSLTPKRLAAKALAEGKLDLAASYLEQGEGCSVEGTRRRRRAA